MANAAPLPIVAMIAVAVQDQLQASSPVFDRHRCPDRLRVLTPSHWKRCQPNKPPMQIGTLQAGYHHELSEGLGSLAGAGVERRSSCL